MKIKNIVITILLIAPLTFSIFTYQRAVIWQKMTRIFFYSEITHPESIRVNEGLAFLYILINDSDSALRHLDKVVELDPDQRRPDFYFKYLIAYCQGDKVMLVQDYENKLNIISLSNELTTVNYFQQFVETVEAGKCSSLDLNSIADKFEIAVANKNSKYDLGGTSHVNNLLARLFNYLGREEEASRQSKLSKISNY